MYHTSEKVNYPVLSMEKILQTVLTSELFSLLYGYSKYNQVLLSEPDKLKTKFHTQWGTFTFKRIPFGLINVGATFQRAMDITYWGLIGHSIVVHIDDVIVFLNQKFDHIRHLKKIFERCRKYGISLNPKKIIFTVSEGNVLGHIIVKSGIKADLERVKTIM